jgi:hypothetical protein
LIKRDVDWVPIQESGPPLMDVKQSAGGRARRTGGDNQYLAVGISAGGAGRSLQRVPRRCLHRLCLVNEDEHRASMSSFQELGTVGGRAERFASVQAKRNVQQLSPAHEGLSSDNVPAESHCPVTNFREKVALQLPVRTCNSDHLPWLATVTSDAEPQQDPGEQV